VLGAPSNGQRFVQAAKLLDWGFDNFERVEVVRQGQLLPMQVRVGANEVMQPVAGSTVMVIVPKKDAGELKMDFAVPASLYGPLASDQTIGHVIVRSRSEVVATFDAVCPLPIGQEPFPVGQQPAVVAATAPAIPSSAPAIPSTAPVIPSSAPVPEVPNERGATIRVVSPTSQAAAAVPAVAAPINSAVVPPMNAVAAPINQTATPVR
jgi:hypothetical protein